MSLAEFLATHRPYGMDCKCGEPINSDEGWARHVEAAWDAQQVRWCSYCDGTGIVPG